MTRVRLAFLLLALASWACMEQIPTATPTPPPPGTHTPTAPPPALRVTPSIQPTDAAQIAEVVVPVVNVRQSPGGEVVGQLAQGETVTILLCDGEWCKIEYDQTTGYIFAGCLSVNPNGLGCSAR